MRSLWALAGGLSLVAAQAELFYVPDEYPLIPDYGPQPNPPYMMDNQKNYYKVAPDKGEQNGAVWVDSGSFDSYMATEPDAENRPVTAIYNQTLLEWEANVTYAAMEGPSLAAADTGYWLPKLAVNGKQPIAGSNYKFYRDVTKYGAKGDGATDDTEAINAAIEDGNRCGRECGNTFAQGAIIYFPPGIYKVCRPIIQLYYTQFIGDAIDMPTLKGCDTFQGIAIIDTDPYIPGGNGANWYINQNQFFRQIRNIKFDLREMPLSTADNDQPLVPTGIHWQVSQACSLQNLLFEMPDAKDNEKVTHVGIFMENGSGGFVSDLTFRGGSIGWRAGSQQYTVINLKFENCLTAVQMIWDWGFNWQRVEINGGAIGFNISGVGGIDGQGVGSISVIDSKIANCPIGILTRSSGPNPPNIVIDNLEMSNVAATVRDVNGNVILGSSSHVELWAIGKRYNGYEGTSTSGAVEAPKKSERLLDGSGKLFYRPRPQYEDFDVGQFRVATDHDCRNDGTGDNTNAINSFLRDARAAGQIAYFPAGIYRVGGTVLIPTGSRVVGASWSQIQGAGAYFSDVFNPRVVVQVGQKGDVGTMEITDMIFNVQGATAGAIVLEWNVHESSQGSAAMWDSHVRVGGATGSDLDIDTCPKFGFEEACICAALLFHITPQASGYFENVWVWLADHDNDMVVSDSPDKLVNQISLYAARGTLIESEGPTWLYGTGSEHVILYQYQLYGAKDVYLGHIQTETPYYQPVPVAPLPIEAGKAFPGDPSFEHCTTEGCKAAWGLRIINSEGITLHSVGMYSFFQEYYQDCLDTFDCQERICEVKGSKDVALFNVFTVGTVEVATGINDGAIMQKDDNQRGFTTEISVWIPLEGGDDLNVVYVGPEVYTEPEVLCSPPCLLVFPTSSLSESTTITPGTYTTSLEYGAMTETTIGGQVVTTFITTTTTVTLPLDHITTGAIQYSNVNVTRGQTGTPITVLPSVDIPPVPVPLPDGEGGSTTRNIRLPPWPDVTRGPPENWGNGRDETSGTVSGVFRTPFVTVVTATGPTVTTIRFPPTVSPVSIQCPPDSELVFNTPRTTLTTDCPTTTEIVLAFSCPTTRVVTFIGASTATISADCTIVTAIDNNAGDTLPSVTRPPQPPDPPITGPLPTYTTFPIGQIEAIEDEEDDDDDDDVVGFITPCNLWFFNICLIKPGIRIRGIRWILPPGVYGPARIVVPPVRLPSPWTIPIPTPPITWPVITVGRDGKVTYPTENPTSCETATASICSTTVHLTLTTMPGTTSTILSTESSCEEFRACGATDLDSTATRTPDSCPLPTNRAKRAEETKEDPATEAEIIHRRAPPPPGCPQPGILYPKDPYNTGAIRAILDKYNHQYTEIRATSVGYTVFIRVDLLDSTTKEELEKGELVTSAYYTAEQDSSTSDEAGRTGFSDPNVVQPLAPGLKDDVDMEGNNIILPDASNGTESSADDGDVRAVLVKRALKTVQNPYSWHLSQDSMGLKDPSGKKNNVWAGKNSDSKAGKEWKFHYNDAASTDQYVYVVGEEGYWKNHEEFKGQTTLTELRAGTEFGPNPMDSRPADYYLFDHGSAVSALISGPKLGICKNCQVRFAATTQWRTGDAGEKWARLGERLLAQLVAVLDEVKNNREGRAVVSMSIAIGQNHSPTGFYEAFYDLLKLLDDANTVLVCAAGNDNKVPFKYPALFGNPAHNKGERNKYIPNLIVVGATMQATYKSKISNYADWITTFAPGEDVYIPDVDSEKPNAPDYIGGSGTSLATPQVAGLAAYYRSAQSPWQQQLTSPARVKKLIRKFHRRFNVNLPKLNDANNKSKQRPIIWNGHYKDMSCLKDYAVNGVRTDWSKKNCPDIDLVLDNQPDNGETVAPCGPSRSRARQDGATCPLIPDDPDVDSGGDSGEAHTVSFTSGATPSPTCASGSGCGGKICSGFFCTPNPTGVPPDRHDPKDPDGGSSVPTRTIDEPSGPTDPPNTCNDKCKLDRGNPCECGESSCSADSPLCCRNASCPMCDCGESGCSSGSPACCSSGTCQWSWTGGGGGDGTGQPPSGGGGDPPPTDPPPTDPPPTDPPPSNPPSRQIVIALSELVTQVPVGPWQWDRDWIVFSSEPNRQINLCKDSTVYSETTSTPMAMVGYPPSMSFEAVDGLKCSYEGTEKTLGTLKCSGVSNIHCEGIDVFVGCVLNNPTRSARVYCSWS